MSENNKADRSFRGQANDRFSVTPIQDKIDTRFEEAIDNTYAARELGQIRQFAARSLRRQTAKDDVYGAEVFVTMGAEDFVYYTEPDGIQRKVAYEGAVIHGYLRTFSVKKLPDDTKRALFAHIEEYSDDTDETQTYQVPLAIEGLSHAPRIHDAPVPVMESGAEIVLDEVYTHQPYFQDLEQAEQDVQWSLLNILERDLFDPEDGVDTTQELYVQAQALINAGFVDDIDDFVTACNYYFAKCAHENDAWCLQVEGEMEVSGGDEYVEPEMIWAQGVFELMAIDIQEYEGELMLRVYCRQQTGDGARLYRGDCAEVESWRFVRSDEDDDDDGLSNED